MRELSRFGNRALGASGELTNRIITLTRPDRKATPDGRRFRPSSKWTLYFLHPSTPEGRLTYRTKKMISDVEWRRMRRRRHNNRLERKAIKNGTGVVSMAGG